MPANTQRRVLVARLFHETHGFLKSTTPLSAFSIRRGRELFACRGDSSTLDGFLEFAAQAHWDVVPAVDYVAFPSGPVEPAVFETFWTELKAPLQAESGKLDALFLILHGAMATTEMASVEGILIERIRETEGYQHIRIFGVYDLHATFTKTMADHANCLVAYRENPHTDARDSAIRAADLLENSFRSEVVPRMLWRHAGLIWPPAGTSTASSPMADLERQARVIEAADEHLWAMNVNAGFAFSDSADTGVSFAAAFDGEPGVAAAALEAMVENAQKLREAGFPVEESIASALAHAQRYQNGPVVLVEPSDNIGAGAAGDSLEILKAFLEFDVSDAGIIINAPQTVSGLRSLKTGEEATIVLPDPFPSGPEANSLSLDVHLISTSDGRFVLSDPNSHLASMVGVNIDMGPCALVRHRGITLLLTSNATPPFDLGQWTSQGIDPLTFRYIVAKAAVGHRRAYDPIAVANIEVATVGYCPSDPRALPYSRLQDKPFPLG